MSKRRIILFASVLVVALMVLIVVFLIRQGNNTLANPFRIIPSDAVVIVQVNNFHSLEEKLFSKNEIYKSLSELLTFRQVLNDITAIDSLAKKHSELGELLFDSHAYLSLHSMGDGNTSFLFLIQLKQGKDLKDAVKALKQITSDDIEKTESKYEGRAIYHFSAIKSGLSIRYYLTEVEGNILVSRTKSLVEASVKQYSEQESLLTNPQFKRLVAAAGKTKDANIYVNLRRFPELVGTQANETYQAELKNYKVFGAWMVLDLNAEADQVLLNGVLFPEPGGNNFIDIFKDNRPVSVGVDSLLPASTAAFLAVGAENLKLLNERYAAYLKAQKGSESNRNKLAEIEKDFQVNIIESLLPLVEGEITLARGNFTEQENKDAESLILIRCKSGEHAFHELRAMAGKIQEKKGGSLSQLQSELFIAPDSYPVVRIPTENLTGQLFGDFFTIQGNTYVTVWRNYLALAASRDILKTFLVNKARKKTLSTNEAFGSFKSGLSNQSYMLFYGDLTKSAGVFKKYLEGSLISEWEEHAEDLQKIQPAGFQITQVGGMVYSNILVRYSGVVEGKPRTVWESQLETTFSFKPQLVQNHYTHENEIFLQDDNNSIYLINSAGIILWKQNMPEAINSKLEQIDYFGNGKLQYLFSTTSKIYLIDRNGNNVEPFPVTLRSQSTTGMSLFDYDGDHEYRIIIPCRNNQVYVYDKGGNILSGWSFKGSENKISQSPQHFRIGDKDYIVIRDKYRVYILNRKGEERVSVKGLIHHSVKNTYHLNTSPSNQSSLVTTDTSGQIMHVTLEGGKIKTVSVGEFSPEHYFDFRDVDADGQKDYIFIDRNLLSVYRQDKSRIFEYEFPNEIRQEPIFFEFSRHDRKLGIVDTIARKIYLINKDGSLYRGFPLEGSTLFSIGFLNTPGSHFNLIVGGRNNFLYNYSVQ
ncbi:MAG: DUF3352 domain-containing protein [Bacteroidales bacterium]|nr:DUF3352 domain-containing protein [Bacteroidales bacterium]